MITANKIANGYLVFTTAAVYLKSGNILRGEYVRIPYESIDADGIATSEGRILGTRKLDIPYEEDGKKTVTLDDAKVTEEKLRDLLLEIKDKKIRVANSDLSISFDNLDNGAKCVIGEVIIQLIKKEDKSLAPAYVYLSENGLCGAWEKLMNSTENLDEQLHEFYQHCSYPSEQAISYAAIEKIAIANAQANYIMGQETSLLSAYAESVMKSFDKCNLSSTEFNRLIKTVGKKAESVDVKKITELLDDVSASEILNIDDISSGLSITIEKYSRSHPDIKAKMAKKTDAAINTTRNGLKKAEAFIEAQIGKNKEKPKDNAPKGDS